jgi:hypothetical protein
MNWYGLKWPDMKNDAKHDICYDMTQDLVGYSIWYDLEWCEMIWLGIIQKKVRFKMRYVKWQKW